MGKSPRLRFARVMDRIELPGEMMLLLEGQDDTAWFLRVGAYLRDNADDRMSESLHKGRHFRLSQHMTDGEIAQTALMAVLAFHEHELREQFKVDGVAIFQPHFDLDALVAMASKPASTKERS